MISPNGALQDTFPRVVEAAAPQLWSFDPFGRVETSRIVPGGAKERPAYIGLL